MKQVMGNQKLPNQPVRPVRIKRCVKALKLRGPIAQEDVNALLALGFTVEFV